MGTLGLAALLVLAANPRPKQPWTMPPRAAHAQTTDDVYTILDSVDSRTRQRLKKMVKLPNPKDAWAEK
jgi:hypothetical protein